MIRAAGGVGTPAAAIRITEAALLAEVDRGLTGLRARATSWEPMWAAAWPAATIAAAAVTGAMVGKGEVKFALLPVAAVAALLFARVPAAGFVAVLWSVGTAMDLNALPEVGASSLRFEPAEVVLWIALGSLVFLPSAARRELISLAVRRESLLVALFLGAILAGVVVGVENGASVHAAALDMRLMLFYSAFWLALVALTSARRLVFALVSTGVVAVVILQVGQVIVGESTRLFLIAPQDVTSSLTDETGFLRVRPPGLTSVYVVAAFSLALLIWGPRRLRLLGWAMTAVTLTGVILSLNRNMLIGLALGLCAAALITPQRHRSVVLVAVLGMTLAGFILLAQDSAVQSNAIVSRIASISNYSELQKGTLADRFYENRIAKQRIRAHPVGGIGWGTEYGARFLSFDHGFVVSRPRPFMHEQYLWLWMRTGLIGLLALVGSLALGIWNGARWCRARHGTDDAWLGAGVVVAIVALAASSNVAIYLTPPDSTVPLVGVLALAAIMQRDLSRS